MYRHRCFGYMTQRIEEHESIEYAIEFFKKNYEYEKIQGVIEL